MDIAEFKKKSGARTFHRHPWEIARGKIIMDLIRDAQNHDANRLPVDHIADIGCGDGYIAGLLTADPAFTRHYSAIDSALDEQMKASLAAGHQPIHFFSSLQETKGRVPPADIVLILDVLEHVPEETALFTDIRNNIPTTPATKWIITVPAFQSVFSRHDTLLGHYRRYNLAQLTAMCQNNNLVIEKKGYFFFSLLLARILTLSQKKRENESTIESWKGNRFLTGLFTRILRVDYKIGLIISNIGLPDIPGLSCYCICHQPQ
ncbi:MAG TPA: class I SAM-dependent methyltransferase [Puia sp.]